MIEPLVLIERDGPVARLVLNRPAVGNAIDFALAEALLDAVRLVEAEPTVRCVLLTGNGRLFCAGGDIGVMQARGGDAGEVLHALAAAAHRAIEALLDLSKPLVVAVNGPAAGAGLALATLGDLVIAGRRASFTGGFTAVGLTPDGGVSWLLPRLVGLRRAQEMLVTNRRVGADEAAAIGLVSRTVDDAELEFEAGAAAMSVAKGAVHAVAATRRLLLGDHAGARAARHTEEAALIAAAAAGGAGREGVAAFLDRRPPDFIKRAAREAE